jgi:hypothetical protein
MKWLGKGSLGVAPGDKDDVAIALSDSEGSFANFNGMCSVRTWAKIAFVLAIPSSLGHPIGSAFADQEQ